MKKLSPFALALLFGCQGENKQVEVFPVIYENESEWVVYEGIIPLESGEELTMELSLRPGSPGFDSDYRLEEWSQKHNMFMMGRGNSGKYTTLIGSNPNEVIIKLNDSRINRPWMFGKQSPAQLKKVNESGDRTTDLFFKSRGNELVMVDDHFEEANSKNYSLIRRSKTFTVEGYITFVNDTSEFFEMNTRENWVLAKRALFADAQSEYFRLAKEKYEGVYMKALAYSVEHVTPSGKNVDALVLRNIYEMKAGERVNP